MTADEARKQIPRARLKLSTRIVPTAEGGDGTESDVCEVWWCDQLVMSIYVGRSPSVNIITKHQMVVMDASKTGDGLAALSVMAHVDPPADVAEAINVVMSERLGKDFAALLKAHMDEERRVARPANISKIDPLTRELLSHLGGGDKGKMN